MTPTARDVGHTTEPSPTDGAIDMVTPELETAQSKLVYVTIAATGETTVDDLAATLGMQKIALLDVCSTLSDRGLVEQRDGRYVPT